MCTYRVLVQRVIAVPDHTQIHTLGVTPVDEESVPRRNYLTAHSTQKRKTSMTPAKFEPAISANG